ncbi:response regulator [Consotaella aegiceratis]|uniref:response regulator n=1 Tax=Consotaella aegiceratis TaxID=3097961 RepID=UPI002F41C5FF
MIAIDLEASLESRGASVACAPTIERAIAAAEDGHFDGAVLDLDLAGRECFPVADVLSAKGIPFFFHTGHGERSALSMRYPNAIVCQKPCLETDLVETLHTVMNASPDA